MRQLEDSVWQRRGISWIWEPDALSIVCKPSEVISLRQFIRQTGCWNEDLPSNSSSTLVVAGLDGCLDLLSPTDAEDWLGNTFKQTLLSFQDFCQGEAALVFWLPNCRPRIKINTATDAVTWICSAPHSNETLDFGRLLWGEARQYPQEIMLNKGSHSVGLFHLRIT